MIIYNSEIPDILHVWKHSFVFFNFLVNLFLMKAIPEEFCV